MSTKPATVWLAGGGVNRARILLENGLSWDYRGMPVLVYACLTTLALPDPLAAILLLARPRLGAMLTVAFIARDVGLNAWDGATPGFQVGAFVAQSLFLAFRAGDCSSGEAAATVL